MPEEKKNLTSLSQVVAQAATPENLDKLLKDWDKYNKIFDRVNETIEKLNRLGLIPAIVRGIGKKYEIADIDKPLSDPLAISATSVTHKLFFQELNAVSEAQIKEMFKQAMHATEEHERKQAKLSKKNEEKPDAGNTP